MKRGRRKGSIHVTIGFENCSHIRTKKTIDFEWHLGFQVSQSPAMVEVFKPRSVFKKSLPEGELVLITLQHFR